MASNGDDIFRILVATDNHLGFEEKNPKRGEDSLNTFQEVLELAVENDADFILLGGDLFHENKPSRQCVVRCMELLRKYTFGDRPVKFEFISDPAENFRHLKNPVVNYHDPNLNVAIPVFSIHGNHDDPSGLGQYCALDMLSTAGLINYFGRSMDLKEVTISPLLLTKGRTKLAIYGLSAIKDERLFRLFKENKVKMLRPKESKDEWFNLMVVHQNRARHSLTNYLPEEFLDDFIDLVIWGHEHECKVTPQNSSSQSFFIVQPGSSVATSLCAGEAVEKHVALLEVNHQREMRVTGLPLKTVRPFEFDDLILADHNIHEKVRNKEDNPVESFITEYIENMIENSKKQLTGHPKQPTLPLIRLRVEYSDESQMFNPCRFGQKFADLVANPEEMILFRKQKKESNKLKHAMLDANAMDAVFEADVTETKVEDLVEQYFSELGETHQLDLLTERGLAKAVTNFVEKDDRDALHDIVRHQINKMTQYLSTLDDLEEENVAIEIHNYKLMKQNQQNKEQDEQEAVETLSDPQRARNRQVDGDLMDSIESDEESSRSEANHLNSSKLQTGRGSRGRRGSLGRGRASTASRSNRGTSSTAKIPLTFESNSNTTLSRGRGRGRGRGIAVKAQKTMDSFCLPTTQSSLYRGRKGAMYDSDSD